MKTAASFASILTRFFTQRLIEQRHASPHTLCCYRDTFRLLLKFIHAQTGKQPSSLRWVDIDAALIGAFLNDLEQHRGITARSRNLRLTAVRSLFRFAAFELPEHSNQIQQVLAIPPKRVTHHQIGYLSRSEQDILPNGRLRPVANVSVFAAFPSLVIPRKTKMRPGSLSARKMSPFGAVRISRGLSSFSA